MSPNSYASTSTLPSSQEEDLFTLKIQGIDVAEMPTRQRMTTDSVRLYLQDIGRVPLLAKEEEVSKAQQIQRYMALVEKRNTAVENKDPEILAFVKVLTIHDQLVSHIGHRPSIERWAKTTNLTVTQLRRTLATGKKKWSQLTNLTVKELEQVEKEGMIAKEQMINANLRLVVSIAKKYQNRGLELLDLIQEGTLGLERAVEKFDPTKGYRFSTYSYWWIRQGITRALATQSRMIRLPVHITEKLNKIKKIQRQVSQEKGRMPTVTEIAQELEITAEQVKEVLTKVPRSVSLEIKVGKDQDTELVDLLETEDLSPEESLMNESLRRDLHNLLLDLTKREREVIELRYGFGDGTSYSLADIGRNLELSRERVRQIEAKALQKLRQPRRRNLIRDYFEALT